TSIYTLSLHDALPIYPYTLEKHEGTEKLWIVWSESGVPELEAVKGVVNPKQKGTISDTGQAEAVRAFLEKYSKINPEIETGTHRSEEHTSELQSRGHL